MRCLTYKTPTYVTENNEKKDNYLNEITSDVKCHTTPVVRKCTKISNSISPVLLHNKTITSVFLVAVVVLTNTCSSNKDK